MAENVQIDLYADPRVENAVARLRSIVPEASLAEGVPEHEIQVYLEEQMNLASE